MKKNFFDEKVELLENLADDIESEDYVLESVHEYNALISLLERITYRLDEIKP